MFKSTGKKKSPIAQGKKACQWLFQHMGGKCPTFANIYIIVWLFPHMCAFSHTYVSKSKHAWKKAPRCQYINVFGVFHTWWVKANHLPKCICVLVYTHVWLVLNIFVKSQTCVEKKNYFVFIEYTHMCEKKTLSICIFMKWHKPNICGFYQTHTKYKGMWCGKHTCL